MIIMSVSASCKYKWLFVYRNIKGQVSQFYWEWWNLYSYATETFMPVVEANLVRNIELWKMEKICTKFMSTLVTHIKTVSWYFHDMCGIPSSFFLTFITEEARGIPLRQGTMKELPLMFYAICILLTRRRQNIHTKVMVIVKDPKFCLHTRT